MSVQPPAETDALDREPQRRKLDGAALLKLRRQAGKDTLGRRRSERVQERLLVDGEVLRKLRLESTPVDLADPHRAELHESGLLQGRNQTEAAKLGGLARNHWSAIECGLRPGVRPSTAFKLAKGVAPEGASTIEIGAIVPQFASVP